MELSLQAFTIKIQGDLSSFKYIDFEGICCFCFLELHLAYSLHFANWSFATLSQCSTTFRF